MIYSSNEHGNLNCPAKDNSGNIVGGIVLHLLLIPMVSAIFVFSLFKFHLESPVIGYGILAIIFFLLAYGISIIIGRLGYILCAIIGFIEPFFIGYLITSSNGTFNNFYGDIAIISTGISIASMLGGLLNKFTNSSKL
jgi:hypothetical protein